MKKNINLISILALCLYVLSSCHDDCNCGHSGCNCNNDCRCESGECDCNCCNPQKTMLELLTSSKWIYDNPEDGVWEEDLFTESGVFYTSYTDNSIFDIQENLNGRYSLDAQGRITGMYKLSNGASMNLDWAIKSINEISMTIVNNTAGLKFTYASKLDEIEVKSGETVMPEYNKLLPDIITAYKSVPCKGEVVEPKVKSFASHNLKIATVDTNTGEITGKGNGCTYIDVVTTEGTAVLEVHVEGCILPYDFDKLIGEERSTIYNTFGTKPLKEDAEDVIYTSDYSDYKFLTFRFDAWTGVVKAIELRTVDSPSFTSDQMTQCLNDKYYVFEKGTSSGMYAYINKSNFDDATVSIVWTPDQNSLVFVAISHDLFPDYSPFLGKKRAQVLEVMGDEKPFLTDSKYIAYGVTEDKFIDFVGFYFTMDMVNVFDEVQCVITYLKQDVAVSDVIKYLNKKYMYMEEYSYDDTRAYLSADGKVGVLCETASGQIMYFSNVSESARTLYMPMRNIDILKSVLKRE